MVLHTARLMVHLHDRLDDRKPDAAAAIFPRSRFIYLVKLRPEVRKRFVRDRISRVKHFHADLFSIAFVR